MSETLSVKEILVSELQCRILVEVYLAHGPVDIFRLWSEMFERQKSISVGMLLFTRAIVQLEDEGYLQKVAEMSSTLAPKGEMYLIGAVLSGELPEGCWEKLSSTQNILDVASQASGNAPLTDGFQVGDEGVSTASRKCSGEVVHDLSGRATDSQFQGTTIDELLALVASKLPDISLSEQARLEEIEAEREGGDTEASGYREPMYERNGR